MKPIHLLLGLSTLLIMGLTYLARVDVTTSDPALTLLLSQAIVQHGTITLDPYEGLVAHRYHLPSNYRIEQIDGHFYYLFPLAPSVFMAPVVWVANLLGMDMLIHENEYALQQVLASLSCGLIFLLIYRLGRYYLAERSSLVIALISVMGSSLVSTLGTALWNLHFAVILVLLILLLVAGHDSGQVARLNPYLLGALLFISFWCRPTAAPFILVVFVYVWFRQRSIIGPLALTAGGLLLLFAAWSWSIYGQPLSSYYLPARLAQNTTFWEAMYGNAFSPGRGLFVFSPFLLLVLGGAAWQAGNLRRNLLFWLCLVWFGLFYVAISRKFPDWWGGNQYGPRLMTDGLPALIGLTILLWREISTRYERHTRYVVVGSYLALGLVGVFIHSYQGLYNPYTNQWNKRPNVDLHPQYIFDWRYPQFLATGQSIDERNRLHKQARLEAYEVGDIIQHDDAKAVFWGWAEPEEQWRWTAGNSARLVFKLNQRSLNPERAYTLELVGASLAAQTVEVTLNKKPVGQLTFTPYDGGIPPAQPLTFEGALLRPGDLNELQFWLPQAGDDPTGGLALVQLRLYPFAGTAEGVYYFDSERLESGFSTVEKDWRWTDGFTATLRYPPLAVEPGQSYILTLTSGALATQTVEVLVNGTGIGQVTITGFEPQSYHLTFKGTLLKAGAENKITFLIPGAEIPEGDSRRLGLAFVSVRIE
jgi:hypothetical protein